MASSDIVLSFDITIDGSIQDVKGTFNDGVLDQQVIHQLLYYAQKTLVDEEVVCITVKSNKYTLKIVANGAKFSGIIRRN